MSKKNKPKSPKEVFQPDDRFFAKVMEDKKNVQACLTDFYPSIAAIADLSSLEQVKDEFIQPTLKTFRADIIYRCRFKDSKEQFYFSLLWEHKSEPEEEVAIQIGLYIFQILYKLARAKDREIEPVLPLLFYNGKKDWKPKTIHELFSDKPYFEFFKKYLPNFDFLFTNITKLSIEELLKLQAGFFRSAMMSMSFRHRTHLIIENISVIFGVPDKEDLRGIITYVLALVERSPKQLLEELENIDFITKPNVMSTLSMLRAEGAQEGRKEGIKKGIKKGSTLQSLKNLLSLLIELPDLSVKKITLITNLNPELIEAFLKRLNTKKIRSIQFYIRKYFLAGIELNKEEKKEINVLVKTLVARETSK